jgi:hypothetical protein
VTLYLARNTARSAAAAAAQLGPADWQTLEDAIVLWNTARLGRGQLGGYFGPFVLRWMHSTFVVTAGWLELGVIYPAADPHMPIAFVCDSTALITNSAPAPTKLIDDAPLIDQRVRLRPQDKRGLRDKGDGNASTIRNRERYAQPGINRQRFGLAGIPTYNEED